MSLMKTLARIAGGVILAKGLSSAMKGSDRSRSGSATRRSGGGLLDQLQRSTQSGSSGSLGGLLGGLLGGNSGGTAGSGRRYGGPNSSGASGGLGGILDQLTNTNSGGTRRAGSQGGSIGDLLGGLLGGTAAGSLASKGAQDRNDASFGELLNDSLSTGQEPEVAPTAEQNAVAGLMLRAMIQAAKADGRIDEGEKERLLGELGDLDEDERQFVREQMAAPVDAEALARDVPQGLEPQVYLMSIMAIDFDSQEEAQYLHKLAQALGLQPQTVNQIHDEVGVQNLYS
ncbi:tellurite resistance TerB family protein [Paracoccus aerodenitrificans]|uniref:tellurite resistance TerB family protein n=1 Tax=Paracoccus aerodenitrificans TaxID=3017781 RepID=UPI0022F0B6EA|nr:tellurite resistance TerB family protein [Paracoccus aerodenitrificans]WBU63137.1 tellurite resistance TerB family protein [Paracoccus aerodenitrificans]